MKKFILKIFFISFLSFQNLFTQNNNQNESNIQNWVKNYPSHFIKGFEHGFLKDNKPIYFLSTSILIISLSRYDKDISNKFKDKPFLSKDLSNVADNYGKTFGWGYFAGVGFITFESLIGKNKFDEYFFKIERVAESIIMTQMFTQVLKTTIFRERPNQKDNHSFPSGHTSSTFALASSLNGLYGIKVGLPAYIFATAVGLQRISSNSHYLSDVISGAVIGIFVGNGFTDVHSIIKNNNQEVNISPNFNSENKTYGLQIRFDF